MDALRQSPVNLNMVGDLASRDVGMSAKLLALVNSPYFGFRGKVVDTSRAVVLLGADAMFALVVTLHAFSCFKAEGVPEFSLESLWNHSARTSCIAKNLAAFEGLGKEAIGQASMAALLHDLGKLLLCTDFADEYNRILEEVRETGRVVSEVEKKVLGTTHAQVGAYLLVLWGIPSEVVDIIANHHSPKALGNKVSQEMLLFWANLFEHHLTIVNPSCSQPELPMLRFEALGVVEKIEMWRDVASRTLEKYDG
ncbi:MAG: HDOD domain-containing protein [Pseudodesulfovibrio sp.]|nr:HDOD domain-containing protein [Pseudodesulfovibrio sp.]